MEASSMSGSAPDSTPDLGLPETVKKLAGAQTGQDAEVSGEEEHDALHWFLTATGPADQYTDVDMDFKGVGTKALRFHLRPQHGEFITGAEERNRKGDTPFSPIDAVGAAAEIVTAALLSIEDLSSGRKVAVADLMKTQGGVNVASPELALRARFARQEGLLVTLGDRVRSISGWQSDRVGEAKRLVMGNAVGKH